MEKKELPEEAYAAYEIVEKAITLQIASNLGVFDTSNFELSEIGGEDVESFLSKKLLDKGYYLISIWEFTCRGYYAELEKLQKS